MAVKPAPILLSLAALAISPAAWAQDMLSFSALGEVSTLATPPNYYDVQAGDTLWEISNRFLGNAYYWPKLWSINDEITNPHWIYPGNRIVFRMGDDLNPPSISLGVSEVLPYMVNNEIVDKEIPCGPDVHFREKRPARTYSVNSFLAEREDVEVYGRLDRARQSKVWLADRDLVYLKMDDPDAYECGDVVSIFRRNNKKVKHPIDGGNWGGVYEVVGEAQILHKYGDYAAASVRKSWKESQRGDLVGPPRPVDIEIEVVEPNGDLEATLLAVGNQEFLSLSVDHTVFLDRGRADGVRVGATFFLVEQRDHLDRSPKEDYDIPPSVVGRVVVVRVDEQTSTAVVTDAAMELRVGLRAVQKVD